MEAGERVLNVEPGGFGGNEALAEFREPDGSAIRAPGSSWIVGARSPGA